MIVPWWPMAALAAGQAVDAALCVKPPSVIQDCLNAVRFPRRLWPVIAPTKAVSAVGLIIGIWWLPLAIVTCVALVVYFVLAVGAHLRARDIGRNLLSAIGLLAAYVAALVFVLRAAGHG
ncbi:MAG: DoxX family protein [Actinomycetota bacterium]|nr:DoxX family protein [Actinomycetota bacterium]